MMMSVLYSVVRPLLFSLDPETAHGLVSKLLSLFPGSNNVLPPVHDQRTYMGLDFRNRIGLAAGFDKNGLLVDALGRLGFGFIEVGTVTPLPQGGNPRPRLFRLTKDEAIINRMGFNNVGMDALLKNLSGCSYQGVLGVNIGKNKNTPNERAADDYITCMEKLAAVADYFTINISSPNTPGLRALQGLESLAELCSQLKSCQNRLHKQLNKSLPLLVKLSPDCSDADLLAMVAVLLDCDIEGVVISNTTLARDGLVDSNRDQAGGLSGRPLLARSSECLRVISELCGDRLVVVGVGGIFSTSDAAVKFAAGADLIQVYSGLIYRGPQLVKELIEMAR